MNLKALLAGELTLGLRMRVAIVQRNYASSTDIKKIEAVDITSVDHQPKFEGDLLPYNEDDVELKRNKSRLNVQHLNILEGRRPYEDGGPAWFHNVLTYKRRIFGRYGMEGSGQHPGIAWPTKETIDDMKEYERVAYPLSIQESWVQIKEQHEAEEKQILQRDEEVAARFAKVGQWDKELKARLAKKENELRVIRERKERLVEEVRRHFGFKVDPRDEKFKEMLEQKEKAEKKRLKEAKKKQKADMMMAKLLDGEKIEGSSAAKKGKKKTSPPPEST